MTTPTDWEKVWEAFDDWYIEQTKEAHCKLCGHTSTRDAPPWYLQQKKIQQLVDNGVESGPKYTRRESKKGIRQGNQKVTK